MKTVRVKRRKKTLLGNYQSMQRQSLVSYLRRRHGDFLAAKPGSQWDFVRDRYQEQAFGALAFALHAGVVKQDVISRYDQFSNLWNWVMNWGKRKAVRA